jgi:hypothetical protein
MLAKEMEHHAPNLFRALGFPIETTEDRARASWELAQGAPFVERDSGFLIKAAVGDHVRLFIGVSKDRKRLLGMWPFYEAETRLPITLKEISPLQ